jgi:hypothetical protein
VLGEFDGFPAPGGGGLFDGSLKIARDITKQIALTAGVRYQIGSATDEEIYNSLSEVMLPRRTWEFLRAALWIKRNGRFLADWRQAKGGCSWPH